MLDVETRKRQHCRAARRTHGQAQEQALPGSSLIREHQVRPECPALQVREYRILVNARWTYFLGQPEHQPRLEAAPGPVLDAAHEQLARSMSGAAHDGRAQPP